MPDSKFNMDDKAVTVVEEQPVRLASLGPESTIELATRMANALSDIVEKKHLYAVIGKGDRAKKYPTVEAWMTIARMDNVVAREAEPPIRHEDGSYEAFVELVRLSDGMVIGRASALCGMPDDEPWGGTKATQWKQAQPPRAEYARRSMAVTRATSRAFRQQYSWIMVLAGYEATPADEMPQDARDVTPPDAVTLKPMATANHDPGGLVGIVAESKDSPGFLPKPGRLGDVLTFKLVRDGETKRGGIKVIAQGLLATQLVDQFGLALEGVMVTCYGSISDEEFTPKSGRTVRYQVMHLDRIKVGDVTLPVSPKREPSSANYHDEQDVEDGPVPFRDENEPEPIPVAEGQVPAFKLDPEERLLIGGEDA